MSLLQTVQLSIEIGGKQICNDLSTCFEPGQIWGILGRNGTGKTTLLHTLCGIRTPEQGRVEINKTELIQLKRQQVAATVGLLLQHHEDSFPSTVLETVLIGRHPHIEQWQWEGVDDFEIARQALERVAMVDMEQRSINQLSGGERQRVAIATLLAQDPEFFLLDEPNSHLDLNHQMQILDNLCEFAKQKQRCVVMALHDINLAIRHCDHFIFLYGDGKVLQGSADELVHKESLCELFQCDLKEVKSDHGSVYIPA